MPGHHHHDGGHEDHGAALAVEPGPLASSVAVGFRAIFAATVVLACVWLASNAREIAPDNQAVVFRFGRVVRTQQAGLLLALPRPFEQVRLLPGPDRQLSQKVAALPPSGGIEPSGDDAEPGSGGQNGIGTEAPPTAAPFLVGDGNVVLLDATLVYRIVDARAFVLAEDRFGPALDRLFRAVATQVAAGRRLNDFLVARSGAQAGAETRQDADAADLRAEVRDALLRGANNRLAALDATGRGLGVAIDRIDTTAWLPPEAKVAFDAVLTATQDAERGVAAARTAAELRLQVAGRERDRTLAAADAAAAELVSGARAATARIVALEQEGSPQVRNTLLLQMYRSQLADLMRRVGSVTVVDPQGGARVITSGGMQ